MVLPPDQRVVSSLKRWSTRFNIAIIFMNLMVLTGWIVNIQFLKNILPQWPNSNPLSAVSLILSALSLIALSAPGAKRWQSTLGYTLAWLILAVGLVSIAAHYVHINIENAISLNTHFASEKNEKMSILSAISLCSLAISLIAFRRGTSYRFLQLSSIIIGIPATIEILDYCFWKGDVSLLADQRRGIITVVSYFLVSLSILFARPDVGLMGVICSDTSGGKVLRKLLPKIILSILFFAELGYAAQQYKLINLETNIILSTLIPLGFAIFVMLRGAKDLGVEDIKRRIAEERMEELNRSLISRTTELETANEELEQLINVASHDLAEPAKTISNYSDLIQKKYGEQLGKDASIYFNFLKQGTRSMSGILKDVLTYGNVCKRGFLEMCDFNTIVAEVLEELAGQIEANKATIIVHPLPTFHCHKDMKQVFYHLISNALKFRKPDKSPKIEISCVSTGNKWQFIVKDNGIGIESQYYEKIFKLFQRLHPKHQYEGSGLGLAICKKAVEFHNGDIWVKSNPDGGSTFYFTISKTLKEEKGR